MRSINKNFYLIIASILGIIFGYVYTDDTTRLSSLPSITPVANADYVDPGDSTVDPSCEGTSCGDGGDGSGSDGGT